MGIPLPETLVEIATTEEQAGGVPSFGRTPALALLRHFAGPHSEWPRFLRSYPWTAQALTDLLKLADIQGTYRFASPQAAAQLYCLTIRRWMGAIAQNPDYADVEIITEVIRRGRLLPKARGLPKDESVTMTPQWHEQCARSIERLHDGWPISKLKERAHESSKTDPDRLPFRLGKGKFQKARPAKDLTDPYWIITHSAWLKIENAIENRMPIDTDEARALLIIMFQCLFGIVEDDVQCIRIGEPGGPMSVYAAEQKVVLHIGSGYYASGRCFRRSDLTLPLPIECEWLLQSSHIIGSGRLLDLWTPDGWLKAKRIVRSKAQTSGYATKPMEWSAHRIHREVAVMHLQQSVPEVCLIEGRPILGYRGPCNYLSIPENKAVQLFSDTYRRTRELMGLSPRHLPPLPPSDPTILHGKQVPHYRDLVARLKSDAESAYHHNDLMACIERLMRLIGMRKSVAHVNPAQFAKLFPERLLLITDKVVEGLSHPHWLWLSPELWNLIDTLDSKLGSSPQLLPYLQGSKLVSSDHLKGATGHRVHRIIHDSGLSPAARIAFRTALRELGAGDLVCDLAMGHAPICGPLDYDRPDSGGAMTRAVKHYLSRLYEEYGINEIALLLARKLADSSVPSLPEGCLALSEKQLERFLPQPAGESSLALWVRQDDKWFSRIWDALRGLKTFPANEQSQRALLLVLVAVECGLPPTYLLQLAPYYTLRNFLKSPQQEQAWFVANVRDCDKGGLSTYPILLGSGSHSQLPLWRYIEDELRAPRNSGDRGCLRGIDWKLFVGVTRDDIGRCIRKLLFGQATGAPISNLTAFELLDRCAQVRSRHLHPGYVAGVFAGKLKQVMNHFSVTDVIGFRKRVPDLCYLNGSPVVPIGMAGNRMPKNPSLSRDLEEIALDASLDERMKAVKAWECISNLQGPIPGEAWIAKQFLICRSPSHDIPKLDDLRSRRIARAITQEREKSNRLKISKPLSLPPLHVQYQQLAAVRTRLQKPRPKIALMPRSPADKDDYKEQISQTAAECLKLITCFALRYTEAVRLLSQSSGTGVLSSVRYIGEGLWCIVRGTKTRNAKRVVRSYFCVDDAELLITQSQSSRIFHGATARMKRAARKSGTSMHLIRHWVAIAAVDRILSAHYLSGNPLLVLESFVRELGHGCMALTYQSYVGSTMATSIVL